MGECRFNEAHPDLCEEHNQLRGPLCTYAAADLEGRVKEHAEQMMAARKLLALCVKWLPKDSDIRDIVLDVGLNDVDLATAYDELGQREGDFTNV